MAESQKRTRFLIISDTHGMEFDECNEPTQKVDVAVHCGDLTDGSKLEEYHAIIAMLRKINAPLKLVIAGNHDFTLDIPAFEKKVSDAVPALDPDLVAKFYGTHGEAKRLFEEVADDAGLVFLDEGCHEFKLQNGAFLTVYASPYTPSMGAWGYQYRPEHGHDFKIPKGVDLIISHGPPRGIMDYTFGKERAGCPHLFAAVARARPRLHCFGHIHEGWGAKLVSWKDEQDGWIEKGDDRLQTVTHFSAIDNTKSVLIEKLANLKPSKFESEQDVLGRLDKLERHQRERCCTTSHCTEDERPLDFGRETLFINAAIMDNEGAPTQRPWLVEIELPRAEFAATESAAESFPVAIPTQSRSHQLPHSTSSAVKGINPKKRRRSNDFEMAKDLSREGRLKQLCKR